MSTENSEINLLSHTVIGCAITVHKRLGPGLLESVYRQCLMHELHQQKLKAKQEVSVPVRYDDLVFETAFRADIIVEDKLLIELKSIEKIMDVHKAQTLTYIKMLNFPIGLLINFREPLLKNGIFRFVNGHEHENSMISVLPSANSV